MWPWAETEDSTKVHKYVFSCCFLWWWWKSSLLPPSPSAARTLNHKKLNLVSLSRFFGRKKRTLLGKALFRCQHFSSLCFTKNTELCFYRDLFLHICAKWWHLKWKMLVLCVKNLHGLWSIQPHYLNQKTLKIIPYFRVKLSTGSDHLWWNTELRHQCVIGY